MTPADALQSPVFWFISSTVCIALGMIHSKAAQIAESAKSLEQIMLCQADDASLTNDLLAKKYGIQFDVAVNGYICSAGVFASLSEAMDALKSMRSA